MCASLAAMCVCVCVCWNLDGAAIGGAARLWAAAAAVDWTRRTRMRTPHGGGIAVCEYTFACAAGVRRAHGAAQGRWRVRRLRGTRTSVAAACAHSQAGVCVMMRVLVLVPAVNDC